MFLKRTRIEGGIPPTTVHFFAEKPCRRRRRCVFSSGRPVVGDDDAFFRQEALSSATTVRFFARKPCRRRRRSIFSPGSPVVGDDGAFFRQHALSSLQPARFFQKKPKLQCNRRVFSRKSQNCNADGAFSRQEAPSASFPYTLYNIRLLIFEQTDALRLEADALLLVERADSLLEGLLAASEEGVNHLGVALVVDGEVAVVGPERVEDGFGHAIDFLIAQGGEGEVDFVVFAHLLDVCLQPFAFFEALEDLVAVNHTPVAVVDDDAVADFRLVGDEDIDFLVLPVFGGHVVEELVDPRRGHDAFRERVEADIDQIPSALVHAELLFLEGDEEVLHQAPVEEGTRLVHRLDEHELELADGGAGAEGGGDEPSLVVVIDEDLDIVARLETVGDIARGEEDFPPVAAVEEGAEVAHFDNFQSVVISYI